MKKILVLFFVATLALCGCSVTQEMKENASFEGLVKFYVEDTARVDDLFSQTGTSARVNASIKKATEDYLKSKGFDLITDKNDAQIIFRPLLNTSYAQPEMSEPLGVSKPMSIGTSNSVLYATLEIQAILPSSGDIWSWRGFSPEMMSINNFSEGNIARQVQWCLEYFPPEKNPDKLSEIRKERRERQIKSEENPFKEVLIKDRKQKKSI